MNQKYWQQLINEELDVLSKLKKTASVEGYTKYNNNGWYIGWTTLIISGKDWKLQQIEKGSDKRLLAIQYNYMCFESSAIEL